MQIWTEAIESPILSWPLNSMAGWWFHVWNGTFLGPKFGLSHRLLSKWFYVSALQNRERGGPWCYECGEDGWRYWKRQSFPIGHTNRCIRWAFQCTVWVGKVFLVYATSGIACFWCYQNTVGTQKRPQEYIQAAVLRRRLERLASKESLQSQPTAAWQKWGVEWPCRVGLFSESPLMPDCAPSYTCIDTCSEPAASTPALGPKEKWECRDPHLGNVGGKTQDQWGLDSNKKNTPRMEINMYSSILDQQGKPFRTHFVMLPCWEIIHHQHVNRFVCSSPSFAAFATWIGQTPVGILLRWVAATTGTCNKDTCWLCWHWHLLNLSASTGYICKVLGRWWDDCLIKDGVNFKLTWPYPKMILSKSLSAWFWAHVVSWKPRLPKSMSFCC